MSELQERGVSNNPFFREISNSLDAMGFGGSARAFTHAVYHSGVGVLKFACGNFEGAGAEFGRAGQQFARVGHSPGRDYD